MTTVTGTLRPMNARRAIVFVVGNRDPLRVDAGDIS